MSCGHPSLVESKLDGLGLTVIVAQRCRACGHAWLVANASRRSVQELPSMGAYVRSTARAQALLALGSPSPAVGPYGPMRGGYQVAGGVR